MLDLGVVLRPDWAGARATVTAGLGAGWSAYGDAWAAYRPRVGDTDTGLSAGLRYRW